MSSTFAIFCLLFGSIHAQRVPGGVKRFEMHVGGAHYMNCGGENVKIALIDSRGVVCETSPSPVFRQNRVVTWSNYHRGNCKHNMKIDSSTKLQIIAGNQNTFCPRKIVIITKAGERFVSTMTKEPYSSIDNNMNHTITAEDESLAGMQKITLQIKNENCGDTYNPGTYYYSNDPAFGCGGQDIRVKVTTGNKVCHTQPKSLISKNHFAFWSGDELGNCRNLNVEESQSLVTIETRKSYDKFGVRLMQIKMSDNDKSVFDVLNLDHITLPHINTNGSPRRFQTHKQWPPIGGVPPRDREVTCPRPNEDACPVNEMVAYKVNSNENMNCITECDRVTKTLYSTDLDETDGTGFRCIQTEYPSTQLGYCCNTRLANNTMPYCPDVSGAETEEEEESQDDECPRNGCPIASVKQYYDPIDKQTHLECEPECDFLNGPADSPDSGFSCYNTTSTRRETKFCCNVQGSNTNLPTCQSSENNHGNEANHGNRVNRGNEVNNGDRVNRGNEVNRVNRVNRGYGVNNGYALNNVGSRSNQDRFGW